MSKPSTRRRREYFHSGVGVFKTFVGASEIASSNHLVQGVRLQTTTSQGNPWGRKTTAFDRKVRRIYGYDPRGNQDIGGSFTTQSVESKYYPRDSLNLTGGNPLSSNWSYLGPAVAWNKNPNFTEGSFLQPSSGAALDAYGTIAISRCLPTNPVAGMGQFLGELHDLPRVPDIRNWIRRAHSFRKAAKRVSFDKALRDGAGEYLNQVFGWAPFVGDLKKFAKTVKDTAPLMEKYARGANHLIHRSYYFPVETTSVPEVISRNYYPDPSLNVYLWTKGGTLTRTTVTTTKRWFKGAFTYHLPKIDPNDNGFVQAIEKAKFAEAEANRLFGLRLTPDLIYKLTPWSWALDWVSTTGNVVHNWSAFANDGLVMAYGYLMEHKTQQIQYSLTDVGTSGAPVNFSQEFLYETKTRRRATPYGFGVNPASFTAKQWAVIAALGISRQPLSLNF